MSVQMSIMFRPYQIPDGEDLSVCIDVARAADQAGIHSITFGDHLLIGQNVEAYPYGQFMHASTSAWLEPLTTLAAMAAVTKKLILATSVLLAPLRAPVLLAKSIATLDVLSKGRTQLAIGTGWQREEYEAVGLAWDDRFKRFDECVRACRAIWGEQPVNFDSKTLSLHDVWALPRPVQARVPLLYGFAMSPRNAQRMAADADGWCPVGVDAVGIRAGVDRLREALAAVGRDISTQHVRVGVGHQTNDAGEIDIARTLERIPELLAAGGTIITVATPPNPASMSEIYTFIEAVSRTAEQYG